MCQGGSARIRKGERSSKQDPFADKLSAWLKTEAGKSRKKRRILQHLHADLVTPGLQRFLQPDLSPRFRASQKKHLFF